MEGFKQRLQEDSKWEKNSLTFGQSHTSMTGI